MNAEERMRMFLDELTPGVPIGFQGYDLTTVHSMYGVASYGRQSIHARFGGEGSFSIALPWGRGLTVCREEINGFPCTDDWTNPEELYDRYGIGVLGGYLVHFTCTQQGPQADWWVRRGDYLLRRRAIAEGGGVEPSIRVFARKAGALLGDRSPAQGALV